MRVALALDSLSHDYKNLIWRRLTPELSRTALRPWASETCKNLHEAAKRARLERIVSYLTLNPASSGNSVPAILSLMRTLYSQVPFGSELSALKPTLMLVM